MRKNGFPPVVLIFALIMASFTVSGCGGGSTGGHIDPPVAPSITTQPASATVTAGQTATFSVSASGTSPLSYQWQKNGAVLSGANSNSYTTPVTTTTDSGEKFTVTVSNSAGSVTSSIATLTVNPVVVPPPTIVSVKPPNVFCPRECNPFSPSPLVTITGTNFGVGDTIKSDDGVHTPTTFPITVVTTNSQGQVQTQVSFTFDSSGQTTTIRYDPGSFKLTITNASGTSNPGFFSFLGNQDILTSGGGKYFSLDQGAKVVHTFDASLNLT